MVLVSNSESKTIFLWPISWSWSSSPTRPWSYSLGPWVCFQRLDLIWLENQDHKYMVLNSEWKICGLGLVGLRQDQDHKFSSLSSSPYIHGSCMVQKDQDFWHGLKGQDRILLLDSGAYWLGFFDLDWTLRPVYIGWFCCHLSLDRCV